MQKGRAGLRDLTEPEEGVQQPDVPSGEATEGGRVTPEHWEDDLGEPVGEIPEREGSATQHSGEETEFDPVF